MDTPTGQLRSSIPQLAAPAGTDVADLLLAQGLVSSDAVASAQAAAGRLDMPVADILVVRGLVDALWVSAARAAVYGLGLSDLSHLRPDPSLAPFIDPATALRLGAVPIRRSYGQVVVAIADPGRAAALLAAIDPGTPVTLTVAPIDQITAAQVTLYGPRLARLAEGRAPEQVSCRNWHREHNVERVALAGLFGAGVALVHPGTVGAGLCLLALVVFFFNMTLKIAALAATLRNRVAHHADHIAPLRPLNLPVVSLLVPLYRERDIASTLIARLGKLDYPPERLDVILITEADDTTTNQALAACDLPPWMRCVAVPHGHPRTKPRALNFALNFARGEVVGIYDAEDRPEPDQIARVAARFAELPSRVACLQGRLDYYNATHNPLARAFTIEYASWFRVLLPGVRRLGLFVPLGGTTVFIRRAALEQVGGWDAHNVTEDAELGLRLARHGFDTEIVETTTFEEANAAVLPWIRQRSRWQKGYLMTWAAAMRRPRALWRDLGAWRFLGFQVQLLCAVLGFLLAPLLWTFIIKPFGAPHPLDAVLTPVQFGALAVMMVASLLLSMAISWAATRDAHLRRHRRWIPFVELYHGLGTFAAWTAAIEMIGRPFFWRKTEHGRFGGDEAAVTTTRPVPPLP